MSLATIYKTLETLKKASLIQELNVGDSSLRYDADTREHPHFFCSECRAVYDLESTIKLADLKEKVVDADGFEIQAAQIYFFGICPKCAANDTNTNIAQS